MNNDQLNTLVRNLSHKSVQQLPTSKQRQLANTIKVAVATRDRLLKLAETHPFNVDVVLKHSLTD